MKKRLAAFIRRSLKCHALGVCFRGTRTFRMPEAFSRTGNHYAIHSPPDPALALDFINLILDDEYGMERIHPPPTTILDVGANIGLFALHAVSLYPHATIHADEPNPLIFPFLEKNTLAWVIRPSHEALGSTRGSVSCVESESSRTGTVIDGGIVPRSSLADALERLGGHIDLLKLDCKGAEWYILRDTQSLRQVRRIRMEYHLSVDYRVDDLRRLLADAGFSEDFLHQNQNFGIAHFSNSSIS
jgi:FkbM family methyltransferase